MADGLPNIKWSTAIREAIKTLAGEKTPDGSYLYTYGEIARKLGDGTFGTEPVEISPASVSSIARRAGVRAAQPKRPSMAKLSTRIDAILRDLVRLAEGEVKRLDLKQQAQEPLDPRDLSGILNVAEKAKKLTERDEVEEKDEKPLTEEEKFYLDED